MILYYFSGTGNSLYTAKLLQEIFPEAELVPLVPLIQNRRNLCSEECVGFIYPVHALTLPLAVSQFIKTLEFSTTPYIFSIATRAGTVFHGFNKLQKLLKRKKQSLSAHLIMNLFGNDPRDISFSVPDNSDIRRQKEMMTEVLSGFSERIKHREIYLPEDNSVTTPFPFNPFVNFLMERLVLAGMSYSRVIGGVQYFYVEDHCTCCGMCARVCLSCKIKMDNGKPLWQKKRMCYMCYACINYCPVAAIQIKSLPYIKSHTPKNKRYPHPYASFKDIEVQKKVQIGDHQ